MTGSPLQRALMFAGQPAARRQFRFRLRGYGRSNQGKVDCSQQKNREQVPHGLIVRARRDGSQGVSLYSDLPLMRTRFRCAIALLCACLPLSSATAPDPIPAGLRAVLNSITSANLKGDLSFLASDALQGRYTPSPELDIAAEFIASQFRAAGLEPGGDKEYFQTAAMVERHMPRPSTDLVLHDGPKTFAVKPESYVCSNSGKAESLRDVPAVIFPNRDIETFKRSDVKGKAIMVRQPDFRSMEGEEAERAYANMIAFDRLAGASGAAVEIVVTKRNPSAVSSRPFSTDELSQHTLPVVLASHSELEEWFQDPNGTQPKTITVDIPAPGDHKAVVKNVIGILRGSDPTLKNTCVLLTAHYDHIGTAETAGRMAMAKPHDADQIYNGANDDGSGTVSVIEIARALAKLKYHPRRSLVFMTFFGEERGELGSKYYGAHPVFPISKTAADINLEQVGRTDSTEGKQVNTASLTGFDYSGVTQYLQEAGRELGIRVYKDKQASDAYFTRSDNDALAQLGVPAHTLTVAFDFPDYHAVGDEWRKIDYDNMARVDRMVALGLLHIANSRKEPQWNAQNPKAAPFRATRQRSAGK